MIMGVRVRVRVCLAALQNEQHLATIKRLTDELEIEQQSKQSYSRQLRDLKQQQRNSGGMAQNVASASQSKQRGAEYVEGMMTKRITKQLEESQKTIVALETQFAVVVPKSLHAKLELEADELRTKLRRVRCRGCICHGV